MPLYEYRCQNCGEFECWLRLAELDCPVHCSTCDRVAQKLISAPNVSLNVGQFPINPNTAPQVVARKQMEPTPTRYQQANTGRPWMISHAPSH